MAATLKPAPVRTRILRSRSAGSCTRSTVAILPLAAWLCLAAFGIAAEPSSSPPEGNDVSITPTDPDALVVFSDLVRKGGTRVIQMGLDKSRWHPAFFAGRKLLVPVALRYKPIPGRDLIIAVAATQDLRVAWLPAKSAAILFRGASDGDLERLTKDLASPDAAQRARAAWRGGWLEDPRVIPPLVAAVQDAAPEVARQALKSLRRLSWDAAVVIVEPPLAVLETACASGTVFERSWAICALGLIGDGRTLALIKAALADQSPGLREAAVVALGRMRGERALGLIWNALLDENADVRNLALTALGDAGGTGVLATVEQALQDHDLSVTAAKVLGSMGGEAALPFLEQAITERRDGRTPDENFQLDRTAFDAIGRIGGDKAFDLVEKELGGARKRDALGSLSRLGGARASALLEQAFATGDGQMRQAAVEALGRLGGGAAAHLVEQAMGDQNPDVRRMACDVLPLVADDLPIRLFDEALQAGGEVRRKLYDHVWDAIDPLYHAMDVNDASQEKALAVLEKDLSDGREYVRRRAAYALGGYRSERSIALLRKTLRSDDLALRIAGTEGLGRIGDDLALELLGASLSDKDVEVRGSAIFPLRLLDGCQAVRLLAQALHDVDSGVRAGATSALGWMAGDEVETLIKKMLADPDAAVRKAAAQALKVAGGGA